VLIADVDVYDENENDGLSRTEQDSHANMPIVGRNSCIIADTGRIAEVNPFTPDYNSVQVPIVDSAIQYECPYSGTSYIVLVIRKELHVPSMKNNLLPPFLLREVGLQVCDTPKIQVDTPSVDNHAICFPHSSLRIPLSLWGIFSYFDSSKPTEKHMVESDKVYLLTPTNWNPHDDAAYAENESSMLDWEGNMIESRHRIKILLSDIQEDTMMAASVQVSAIESNMIDELLQRSDNNLEETVHPRWAPIPKAANQVPSILV
jgi:hypothetical protein